MAQSRYHHRDADAESLAVIDGKALFRQHDGVVVDAEFGEVHLVQGVGGELTAVGDGTFYIEINFGDDPIVGTLDDKHLLFTGSGYTLLELYY